MKLNCEHIYVQDLIVPPDILRDDGKCSWHATESGTFRLSSAKDVKLYSVEVWKNGGHFALFDGNGRVIFAMPSVFTGSFNWQAHSENGLICRVGAGHGMITSMTINWCEY